MMLDGYIRISRVAGREGEGFISPREQRRAIEAWAEQHNVWLGEIVEELDVSGATRPEDRKLERLLRRCESCESQGIVVHRVDRFSRDVLDAYQAAKRLKECGARLVGAGDGVDTATENGRFVLQLMAAVAEQYRDRVRNTWQRVTTDAIERGVHVGAYAPAGYLRGEDGRLTLDPETAAVVAAAFRLRASGASLQEVANFLTEEGVRPGGSRNAAWSRSGAAKLVRNRVYLGEVRGQGGAVNRDAHEPLVTPELFAVASKPGRAYPRNGATARLGLLAGIIKCDACGHRLRVSGKGETATYACLGHFASGECPAPAAAQVRLVDDFIVWKIIEAEDPLVSAVENAEQQYRQAKAAAEHAGAELEAYVKAASALDPVLFTKGLEVRQEALADARRLLYENPDPGNENVPVVEIGEQSYRFETFGDSVRFMKTRDPATIEGNRAWIRRYVADVRLRRAGKRGKGAPPIADRVSIRWVSPPASALPAMDDEKARRTESVRTAR
jgi:site-specific DNA recombinase